MKRRMRLPDTEIAALFCDEIVGRFTWVAGRENGLDRFCDALVGGGSCAAPTVLRLPYRVSLGANLFEGFEIWDTEGGKCCVYHRVFPIIYLSSSLIKRAMQLEMYAAFGELIATEFARHAYLEASGSLSGAEREYFSHMRVAKESMPRYTTSGVF